MLFLICCPIAWNTHITIALFRPVTQLHTCFNWYVQNAATKTNNGNTIELWFMLLVWINENIFNYASAVINFAVNLHNDNLRAACMLILGILLNLMCTTLESRFYFVFYTRIGEKIVSRMYQRLGVMLSRFSRRKLHG